MVAGKFIHGLAASFFCATVLTLSSCATRRSQTDLFFESPPNIPEVQLLAAVPFIDQTENFCGPASLTMVMKWAGKDIGLNEVGAQTFTPGKNGTLQADMLGASRRHGMMAVTIRGIPALLNEISSGNPVIVLQNLAFSFYPKWHYAVALGYDLKTREIILHSGHDAFERVRLESFERTWELANHWGVVVLTPKKLSASAGDLEHASAAAVLEQMGKTKEAEQAYESILKKWPDSLGALFGMGNIRHASQDYKSSVLFFERATAKHPASSMAWHNLAQAQGAAKMSSLARKSARQAVTLAEPDEVAAYRKSLSPWL